MSPNITDLLSTLSSTPNWKYQLGLAQIAPQEQANLFQYQEAQQQMANQLQEFQAQQALAQAQQQWQQQFANTGQQFGQQQQAAQNSIQNQSGMLQNWLMQLLGPSTGVGQVTKGLQNVVGSGATPQSLQNQIAIAQSGLPYFNTPQGTGVGGGMTPGQIVPGPLAGTGYKLY